MFWFRRDLRIEDNHVLFQALQGKNKVLPIFIFDPVILDRLPKKDARVEFILLALGAIDVAMLRKIDIHAYLYRAYKDGTIDDALEQEHCPAFAEMRANV